MLGSLCEALDLICRTQRIGWGQQTRAGYGGAHFYQHWTGGGRKIKSLRLSSAAEVGGQPGIREVLSQTKSKQTSGKARRVPESKTCAPGRRSALPGAKPSHFLTSSCQLQCSHHGFIVCLITYIVNHYIHFGIM